MMDTVAQVEYFYWVWRSQGDTLPVSQKDDIGLAYLKHIIGVNEGTARAFVLNGTAYDHIGQAQAGIAPRKNDYRSFWTEVAEITPGVYSQEDLDWLIASADISGIWSLTSILTHSKQDESKVLAMLSVNAHAYK